MVWPNFLVIGAAKSGTTFLYHYLAQHPEIFMSRIRTGYFGYCSDSTPRYLWGTTIDPDRFPITNEADYLALFDGVTTERAIGEVSALYLGTSLAPVAIRRQLPDVRLVAILRNPIDRAYSGYQMHLRNLRTHMSVAEAFEPDRHWVQAGMYYAMLRRYFDFFDPAQIKVFLFDDLKADPAGLLRNLYRFLDVDEQFVPASPEVKNPGGTPRNRALTKIANVLRPAATKGLPTSVRHAISRHVHAALFRRAPPLPLEIRHRLRAIYQPDVTQLSTLLGLDLETRWLETV
jgi:hypothetical protein